MVVSERGAVASSKQKAPERFELAGQILRCPFCAHDRFWRRKALLNTAGAEFMNLAWANRSAFCFVCDSCGHIQWFLPPKRRAR